jgi:tetraacyldisaccharide 4'-kinase
VLSIGPEGQQAGFAKRWAASIPVPHVNGALRPLPTGLPMQGLPVVAFAGIGYPQKFFQTLTDMGADLRATHALADHQPLTDALMARILREAKSMNAQVVTTEKDAVRLPPALRPQVMTVPVRLEIADWAPIDAAFDGVFA